MYRRKVLEINGDDTEISLPIVKFPPFKLRALLIEKDPVVWLHCLETYVKYMDYLLFESNVERVDDITRNNICIFVKSYLHEMAEDKSRVLSLGMNHDVAEVLSFLREKILVLLQRCGLLHLQVFGDSLWDLVKVYVDEKCSVVRALLDGSCKPSINTQKASLNRIPQVQQYLRHLVESGGFKRVDLKAFECLLSATPSKTTPFAKQFLNASWLEVLELLWAKGRGRFSAAAKQLEIITLLSVSAEDIANTTKEMGLVTLDTAELYPLLGSLLLDESFKQMKPDLTSAMPQFSLNLEETEETTGKLDTSVDESSLRAIGELFPNFTKHQLSYLLRQFEGSVEMATNAVFEDPSIIDGIPKEAQAETDGVLSADEADENETDEELELQSSKESRPSNKTSQSTVNQQVPDELRNRTLTRAMKLMYQADEDERDDTYDEAEVSRSMGKIAISDENSGNDNAQSTKTTVSDYDRIEGYLWDLLKQDNTLFERSKRGSSVRKSMRQQTNWSDEQIEGWARMLERSPQRARILEEKFMFRGNVKSGKTAYVKNQDSGITDKSKEIKAETGKNARKSPVTTQQVKRQQARNEKNKSSRANHNRKSGHDKKLSKVGI